MMGEPEPRADRGFVSTGDLARALRGAGTSLFLDVDGTLLPIRSLPGDVVSDGGLRACLTTLRDVCGGALALVSGRTIADLDRIFAPLVLPAAGTHGAELRFADGSYEADSSDVGAALRADVERFVAARPGLLLEDKGRTIAVHFRQRPELEGDVVAALTDFIARRPLTVQRGKMVAELKPVGIDKGRAIARLMTTPPFIGRRPAFFGDDVTDESGFRYVNSVAGLSVRVGPLADVTSAEWRLPDVDAVVRTLSAICSNV